ncbi:MAG TPA: GNAT family N-acetyltransferase, partial [Thermomicrobiales bacterium]|nr:GNAT family N-acetyltransferase [Thermomicrobiales bacterium]
NEKSAAAWLLRVHLLILSLFSFLISHFYAFRPLRRRDALAASRWRYPPPYAVYDISRASLLAIWAAQLALRPLGVAIYYAALDDRGDLVGLFTYLQRGDTVEIGLGLRPDLTGRGNGLAFLEAGLAFGRRLYAPASFRLTVATFNERAITVYERAGFRRGGTRRRGRREELEMVKLEVRSEK